MRTQTGLDTSARNAATANDEHASTMKACVLGVFVQWQAPRQFRVQGSAATARAAAPVSPGCNAWPDEPVDTTPLLCMQ